MNIRIEYGIIKKFLLLFFIFVFSALNVQAQNALSSVSVSQTAGNSYNITLKTDGSVRIKKYAESENNLLLVLNSVVPADSVEIVYDNASGLENVIVQKKNDNNTTILFQGKNVENSKIFVKELSTGLLKPFDSNTLSDYLYIENIKYFSYAFSVIVVLFLMMILFRPGYKIYRSKQKVSKKTIQNSQTLRTKQYTAKRYIPSINYKVSVQKRNMTIPKDFVISNHMEEKIRKAG